MKSLLRASFAVALVLLMMDATYADDAHGHKERYGKVSFPITATAEARRLFERGVAIIHSFGYEEAERLFNATAETDRGCAMAYWGIAMSQYHPIWEPPDDAALDKGLQAVGKAKAIGAKTERERDYIDAVEVFFKDYDKADHRTRARYYMQSMERLHQRYPRDDEAAVFYALSLLSRALNPPTDKTYANQKKAGAILERVFAKRPDHPGIVHYIIHAYDYPPLAGSALKAARTYARIAPSAPHALHMPSHIFTRLGLWEESAKTNAVSAEAARDLYARGQSSTHYQLHALDYMVYAYLQLGREAAAKQIVEEESMIEVSERDDWASAYAHAAIPARYALEGQRWSEAAELKPRPSRYPYAEAITYFARAVGAARGGDTAAAVNAVEKLQAIRDKVAGDGAATLSKDAYSWVIDQIEVQRRAAAAWLAWLRQETAEAELLMRAAAELEDGSEKDPVSPGPIQPARESLGELLAALNRPEEAKKEFLTSLKTSPNRARSLFGAARAAAISGDKKTAKALYAQFVRLWSKGEKGKTEMKIAQAYLRE